MVIAIATDSGSKEKNKEASKGQLEAELIDYVLQLARARAIIARLEKDKPLGQESDSDLSSLASSLFDGIEL